MRKLQFLVILLLILAVLALTACSAAPLAAPVVPADEAAQSTAGVVELRYMLWDANQLPPYRACADEFTKNNPNISVKIDQLGWSDYWKALQTEFVTGNGPDIFTNQLSKFPEFANKNQLVDIQPYVDRDAVDTSVYLSGLTDLWMKDGKRYGLPKDWDSISVLYSVKALENAGVTVEDLNNADWNPNDGGAFEAIVAILTLDSEGRNGLDPNFDPTKVVQYGLAMDGLNNAVGNVGWSNFAYSNGWKFNDGPWDTKYYYDDPKLVETVEWIQRMMAKGFMPPYADIKSLGSRAFFTSEKAALTMDGSWMINWYANNTNFAFGFAMLPAGAEGRQSMFNGLADSIWVGTKHQEDAWQFLKYLASEECATIVGASGVVFPAHQPGVDAAMATFAGKGLDVSSFTDIAKPETTYLYPIADHASEVEPIMNAAFDSIYLGEKSAADALAEANLKVNALFQ